MKPAGLGLELFASTVGRFLLRIYLSSYVFLRRRRSFSFTSRNLYVCVETFLCFLKLSDQAYVSCSFFNSKFKPETDWNFAKTLEIHASNWTSRSMLTVEPAVTCRLRKELSVLHQTKLIDNLSHLPLFDQWYFTSLRRSRNKKITEIRAGSLSQRLLTRLLPAGSPRFLFRSLPLARVLSNVSLLAGYRLCFASRK